MSIEAYNLYQDLVKVFDTTLISQNEFMCRAGVVGWSKLKFFQKVVVTILQVEFWTISGSHERQIHRAE